MNCNDFLKAMTLIESDRSIDKNIVIAALSEALVKAYRKHVDIPDALVRVDINEQTGDIKMYQQFKVVEKVEIDELEIALEKAKELDQQLNLDDFYEEEVSVDNLGRAAALLAKNVLKQKIREAEKQAVYDEYIDKLDEMVLGNIESVEEKFIVINLGKTLALMPKMAQIPNERYYEGQKVRVVITEVNKDTKGAQVLVSRSDPKLVRRLFEKEVPEIFQGIVEIKALAREAGERTKMAVYSKNPDIDPIGACIGPRGSRVQIVIEELKGEKIDIFEWSDNVEELIKNALAPAQILAVIPSLEKKGLLVIVDDNQLSLAIGKKGKNARLAVKLTNNRIDIKTKTDLEEQGIDYKQLAFDYAIQQEKQKREKAAAELAKLAEKEKVTETVEKASNIDEVIAQEEIVLKVDKPSKKTPVEKPVKKIKKPLRERTEYVSKFERLAEGGKPVEKKEKLPYKRRKEAEVEERKFKSIDIRKEKEYEIKPEYSPEELAEIEARQAEIENSWVDDEIDFDEFEEYYEE
ncbi:MAG: transcription termination factor NusA [Erysipelotrichaceae bacterium]|nr:transcription termination factor NusA [Erysipelotrichaceae bacterium]MDD3923471.1 transcription termination factor NusA [Erysipelotrichaceae bacterium]MDD4642206.1 transcription termination factor NusA [Erysipelotrichaceae bacterium]